MKIPLAITVFAAIVALLATIVPPPSGGTWLEEVYVKHDVPSTSGQRVLDSMKKDAAEVEAEAEDTLLSFIVVKNDLSENSWDMAEGLDATESCYVYARFFALGGTAKVNGLSLDRLRNKAASLDVSDGSQRLMQAGLVNGYASYVQQPPVNLRGDRVVGLEGDDKETDAVLGEGYPESLQGCLAVLR